MKHASILHSILGLIMVLLLGMFLTSTTIAQPAPKISELFVFSCNINGCHNGSDPSGAHIQVSDGDFYGTTALLAEAGLTTVESGPVGIRDLQFVLAQPCCCV